MSDDEGVSVEEMDSIELEEVHLSVEEIDME